jgi:hypothetical protein
MIKFGMQYLVRATNRNEFLQRFRAGLESLAADRKAEIQLWQSDDDATSLLITNDGEDQQTFTNFLRGQGLIEAEQPLRGVMRIFQQAAPEKAVSISSSKLINFAEPYYLECEAA